MPISGEMIWINEFTRTYPRGVECVTCFGSEEYRMNGLCLGADEQVCLLAPGCTRSCKANRYKMEI